MKFQLRASAKIAIVGACVLSAQIAAETEHTFPPFNGTAGVLSIVWS
jgi:hypothetical protein